MTVALIYSGVALGAVTTFAVLALLATRRASRFETQVANAEIANALLKLDLKGSKKQRRDLALAVAAAHRRALHLQETIDEIAPYVPRSHLSRVRAHIDELLQFVAKGGDDSDGSGDAVRTDEPPVRGPATEGDPL